MPRRFWHVLAAFLLALGITAGAFTTAPEASASVPTLAWPSVPLPMANVFGHDNGSVTVANGDCGNYYSWSASSNNFVTLGSDGAPIQSVVRKENNWQAFACGRIYQEIGPDSTDYLVQDLQVSPYGSRLIAMRNGVRLWQSPTAFVACGANSSRSSIQYPTLGYDGNIYAIGNPMTCGVSTSSLLKFNGSTGAVTSTVLPGYTGNADGSILPYSGGIAVVNNGQNIYYYGYDGTLDSAKTFSPTGTSLGFVSVASNGRTFAVSYASNGAHVYYKDTSSTTVSELALPTGATWVAEIYATPSNGAAVIFLRSSDKYVAYYNSSGTLVYEAGLNVNGDATVLSHAVDASGNFIVARLKYTADSQSDRNLYLDAYNPAGTSTRIFDSGAEFGSSSLRDFFSRPSTTIGTFLLFGSDKIYLPFCHASVPLGQGGSVTCDATNTQIAAVSAPGGAVYPRSELYTTLDSKLNYVALGDSYSAGEGNPPFIAPTDNNGGNGCDRSAADAYPVLLAADTSLNLSLRAFVACSGATSAELIAGKNGEPSQLTALNEDTDIVTITAGGNDSGFPDFAAECVFPGCDTTTPQYISTMSYIDNYLQGGLEQLYEVVRDAAPNAQIFVVGYPRIAPPYNTFCEVASTNDGIDAVNNVANNLNDKIEAAVDNSGDDITFVDPTATGSPFLGHELCVTDADSYFYSYNNFEHRFSFHPNADGQAAYKELIASYM